SDTARAQGNTLLVSATSLTFNYVIGFVAPNPQAVQVTSSGAPIAFTATPATQSGGAWLVASPANGTTPFETSIAINPSVLGTLAQGTYQGTVTFASAGSSNSPVIRVTLNVRATSDLVLSPTSFTFTYQAGGALPAAQPLQINSNGIALNYSVS